MKPLWIILIVVIVLAVLVVLFIVVLNRTTTELNRPTESYRHHYFTRDIHPLLENIQIVDYCFLNKSYIATRWDNDQATTAKFEKRPFVCITSTILEQHGKYLVIPETSQVNEKRYLSSFYLLSDTYRLNLDKAIIIDKKSVNFNKFFSSKPENKSKLNELHERSQELAIGLTNYWNKDTTIFKILEVGLTSTASA